MSSNPDTSTNTLPEEDRAAVARQMLLDRAVFFYHLVNVPPESVTMEVYLERNSWFYRITNGLSQREVGEVLARVRAGDGGNQWAN